jgi:hypothetical protein
VRILRTTMTVATVAAAIASSQAAVAGEGAIASLTPGKPAGVVEAQRHRHNLWLIGGAAAVVIVGVAIAAESGGNAACGSTCSSTATSATTS